MRSLYITLTFSACALLSSCALITVPVKVAGKVATTSVGLVGKAAGAGFSAVTPGGDEDEENFEE